MRIRDQNLLNKTGGTYHKSISIEDRRKMWNVI